MGLKRKMMRNSKFIRGFTIKVVSVIGCFLLGSCVDSNTPLTEKEEQVPLKLCVSLTDNGYTSDSEIIPMSTRAEEPKPYVVTQISMSTLFIMKKVNAGWCVINVKKNIVRIPRQGSLLWFGEKLELTETDFVLAPGVYQFLLLVNAVVDPKVSIGDVINENEVQLTLGDKPSKDFFLAKEEITVAKNNNLDPEYEQKDNLVKLDLHRNSALIRFILEGDDWSLTGDAPTVKCELQGDAWIGIDAWGELIWKEEVTINSEVDIKKKPYVLNGKNCYFSSVDRNKTNLSLFAFGEDEKSINLNILRIGAESDYDYVFQGKHDVGLFSFCRNHITTILIRKSGDNQIETVVNPVITDWNNDYPLLEYIELNNN